MSQHIEIEFKNMLTKAQYDQMLRDFAVAPEQIIRQVNHYFDTPDQHLKRLKVHCAFVSLNRRLNVH